MPGNTTQRMLVGRLPNGELRMALHDHLDADEAIARFLEHMPAEKASEIVWTVEERTLR